MERKRKIDRQKEGKKKRKTVRKKESVCVRECGLS